jgi:hypothetical protein
MKGSKPLPHDADEPEARGTEPYGPAYGAWFMANVRREIAAARLRETIDEQGQRVTIR